MNKMNKAKFRYIKKWYCCTEKGSWKQSERLLYLEINNLSEYYNVYMYQVKPISDFKRITSHSFKTNIISEFSYVLVDDTIEFDRNKYLIGFESKEYDLQHHQLIDYKPEYYISMSTGYEIDRNDRDIEKENLLRDILKDIAVDQIDFLKQLLARILLGQTFEKFIVLRGCGGNGKSLLLEL